MKILKITKNGNVVAVTDGKDVVFLEKVGDVVMKKRNGYIEPYHPLARMAFVAIREIFGENSSVYAWAKKWRIKWMVDMSPVRGPKVGPFDKREDAVEWEYRYMKNRCTKK